jgi:hypothetical protein
MSNGGCDQLLGIAQGDKALGWGEIQAGQLCPGPGGG